MIAPNDESSVTHSVSQSVRYVGIELLGQPKMNMIIPVKYQPIGKGPIYVLKVDLAIHHTNQNVKEKVKFL